MQKCDSGYTFPTRSDIIAMIPRPRLVRDPIYPKHTASRRISIFSYTAEFAMEHSALIKDTILS